MCIRDRGYTHHQGGRPGGETGGLTCTLCLFGFSGEHLLPTGAYSWESSKPAGYPCRYVSHLLDVPSRHSYSGTAVIQTVGLGQTRYPGRQVRRGIEPFRRTTEQKATFLAATSHHSGDWLVALPITSCGLRMDNEAVRVAVSLRLGLNLCAPHTCQCGSPVDAWGIHALVCKHASGSCLLYTSPSPRD